MEDIFGCRLLGLAVLCFFIFPANSAAKVSRSSKAIVPDEQRLLTRVFRNYDNSVRPVYNATMNVVVSFGLTLIQIMDMDEKNQVLVTNVWLEHSWQDERMTWDPQYHNNISVFRVPAKKLWRPDIVLYNNADDFTAGYMSTNAMVHADGTVFWSPPARLQSSCKVDITFFPFDKQRCALKFGSWSYDQAQVDIVKIRETVDFSNYVTNGEFDLLGVEIERNEVVYPIGDEVYPDVTAYVIIQRKILYYILNIILPCAWLNVLSLLAFRLPPDAGEKISLGITVLLAYSVFMLLIAESMPPTSEYIPLIGIYLTTSMALTSFSVILTVCVLKLHHCGPHQTPVPQWIRSCILRKPSLPTKIAQDVDVENDNYTDVNHHLLQELIGLDRFHPTKCNQNGFPMPYRASICDPEVVTMTTTSDKVKILEEILECVKSFLAKREEEDSEREVTDEWKLVAEAIDRVLFWLFLSVTVAATLLFMIIPLVAV